MRTIFLHVSQGEVIPKQRSMKHMGECNTFLSSAPDGAERIASHAGCFIAEATSPGIPEQVWMLWRREKSLAFSSN
jgi:hypothetical protein